jgi:glutathione S-transferase
LYREESPEWEAAGGVIGPVFGAFARLMKNKEEEEEEGLRAVLVSALKAVDAHLEKCGGPYLLGAEISAMDLNFGPKVHHIVVAGMEYKGVGIAEYKNVQRMFDTIRETDAWKETACADEEVVRGWSRFFE